MEKVYTPGTVAQALDCLASGDTLPVAGGTGYLVDRCKGKTDSRDLVSLDRLDELRGIEYGAGFVRIGGLATFAMLEAEAALPACLRQAACDMGAPQIRNRATLGGNIVSASPAADSVPPLVVLGATLTLATVSGEREVPLEDFLHGPGKTDIKPGELLLSVTFPTGWGRTGFSKLGRRNALAISVANLAVNLHLEAGHITRAAIAAGAVGPTVVHPKRTKALLAGSTASGETFRRASEVFMEEIAPIGDIRATAEYRRQVAASMLADLLGRLAKGGD